MARTTKKSTRKSSTVKKTVKKSTRLKKSKKQIIFDAWKNGKGIVDPQKLVNRVRGAVAITSVRTWLSWWKHGKNFPKAVA